MSTIDLISYVYIPAALLGYGLFLRAVVLRQRTPALPATITEQDNNHAEHYDTQN